MVVRRLLAAVLVAVLAALAALAGPAVARPLTPREASLEIVLDPLTAPPREREMILATLRGTFEDDVAIARYEIEIPRMPGFDWMQLTRDAWRAERVDGRQVRIMERRLAFFPRRAGSLTIQPVRDVLTIADPEGGRSVTEIRSEALTVEVEGALASDGAWWLPAKMIELSDRWDKGPGQLEPGATVTRRVTLWVLGATAEMLPPQPPMREPWLITFVGAEERTTELTWGGPISTVTWEWTFQPKTGEPGVLPQVEIPFFDTLDREVHAVTLPATPIAVLGFGENRVEAWRDGFGRGWAVVVAGVLGVALVLGAALSGVRLATTDELRRRVARVVPTRRERALMRAARAGDLAAFRSNAATLLRARPPAETFALERVDRALFARAAPAPDRAELVALARALRRSRAG
ncbi:hypothetical protein [Acuticoccus sp. I52.16.1]|uniref:hypothetical protein n=1 Tax=Acuticoccus sp. I52.16.1 TaxID=2928472 RepID=UPI001FD4741B|nr:hypothetical protein [Acuticoccus sp. I52.16.1]UOM35562.1 hypothetical protein MRB58_04960 [Acuticoccus sp. I52.16.1]